MKLRTLGLLMASAIGMNVYGLEVGGRIEIDTGSAFSPTVLTDEYYSNSLGQTYRFNGSSLESLYTLTDSILINVDGDKALGYVTDTSFSLGNYFLCDISECNSTLKRTYISGIDYLAGETAPHYRSTQNMSSGYGHRLVTGRVLNTDQFTSAVVDSSGIILDSFNSTGGSFTYLNNTTNYLTATTGITKEEEFKLMTASYGDNTLKFKQWSKQTETLIDLPLQLSDEREINSVFPYGLMPIAISEPKFDGTYNLVLAGLTQTAIMDRVLWGDVQMVDGVARFVSDLKTADLPTDLATWTGYLTTSNPMFNGSEFTFRNYHLNLEADELNALTIIENNDGEKVLGNNVYKRSENGSVVLYESGVSFKVYQGWTIGLISNQIEIDPYLDPSIEIVLSTAQETFYGAEVSCLLQTKNAVIDNNDYIALSPTALQVPIEWNETSGEWKGAQSLTGLDSLADSHSFAQFDLIADVTTGTWTMSCSGFGSDILGNKLSIAPTDITLNLDDKIHGGSGVISGSVDLSNHGDYSGVVVTITFENGRHIEVTPDENGDFSFDRLVEGEFEVHVYNEQYVAGCNTVQVSNANTNQPLNIVMVAGDINGDDAVDIGDYSYMSSMYGLTAADEGFDAVADLNQDDVINVQDLSILGSHFGTDQCEAPLPQ